MINSSLNECHRDFEAFLLEKSLNPEKDKDVWGNEIYKYPLIDAMWYAWRGCWELCDARVKGTMA